ncbi:unnamed protein product [Brassicogethes aeneus]|uniref:Uncharacterized protein n=1 Tax=Brassicogethes aeneus TaxID=1431903 RepID=A0A9P0FEB4_BRAAE|nr:unnamed protein product [Brassicogethes aeneus]
MVNQDSLSMQDCGGNQKQIKDNKNQEKLQVHFNEGNGEKIGDAGISDNKFSTTLNLTNQHLDESTLEHFNEIFSKSLEMKEVAKTKNLAIEKEFADLKERLSTSSDYLLRIKKNIENIKFSYQRSLMDMNKSLTMDERYTNQSKQDMKASMEEIRKKIENLQHKVKSQREKQEDVSKDYKSAFEKVINTLQEIESGSYSSQKIE